MNLQAFSPGKERNISFKVAEKKTLTDLENPSKQQKLNIIGICNSCILILLQLGFYLDVRFGVLCSLLLNLLILYNSKVKIQLSLINIPNLLIGSGFISLVVNNVEQMSQNSIENVVQSNYGIDRSIVPSLILLFEQVLMKLMTLVTGLQLIQFSKEQFLTLSLLQKWFHLSNITLLVLSSIEIIVAKTLLYFHKLEQKSANLNIIFISLIGLIVISIVNQFGSINFKQNICFRLIKLLIVLLILPLIIINVYTQSLFDSINLLSSTSNQTCTNLIYSLPEQTLSYFGSQKYYNEGTSCEYNPDSQKYFVLAWERLNSHQTDQIFKCLNLEKCEQIIQFYRFLSKMLVYLTSAITITSLLATFFIFKISKYSSDFPFQLNNYKKMAHSYKMILIICFLIMLLAGCLDANLPQKPPSLSPFETQNRILSQIDPQLESPEESPQKYRFDFDFEPIINKNPTQVEGNRIENRNVSSYDISKQKQIEYNSIQDCSLVRNLIQKDEYFSGTFDFMSKDTDGIRTSLLASSGSFSYLKDNSGKLFFIESGEAKITIFDFLKQNPQRGRMPFISIIGTPDDVNSYLNESLYYCGANPSNLPSFLIENISTHIPILNPSESEFNVSKAISSHQKKRNKSSCQSCSSLENPANRIFETKYHISTYQLNLQNENEELCRYLTGQYKSHQGNFTFLSSPLEPSKNKIQKIFGRILTQNPKSQNYIQHIPVCNQKIVLFVSDKTGKETEVGMAFSDPNTGEFQISLPYFSDELIYTTTLAVQNENFQQSLSQIQIGRGQVQIFAGNIHLSNTYGKSQPIKPENQCTSLSIKKKKEKKSLKIQKLNNIKQLPQKSEKQVGMQDWNFISEAKNDNQTNCHFIDIFNKMKENEKNNIEKKIINNQNQKTKKQELQEITDRNNDKISKIQSRNIVILLVDILSVDQKNIPSSNSNNTINENDEEHEEVIHNQQEQKNNCVLALFRNHLICGSASINKAVFIKEIDDIANTSEIIIFNQTLGDYTLQVKFKEGSEYHSICKKFTLSSNFDPLIPTDFKLNAQMVKRNKNKGSIMFQLEFQPPEGSQQNSQDITLGLSASFDEQTECLVSTYNKKCNGFKYTKTPNSQIITIENTQFKKHLIFVQNMPADPSRFILSNANNSEKYPNRGNEENDYEIGSFNPPLQDKYSQPDPYLTWLVACFDGSVGRATIKPFNKYYDSSSNNNKLFPNSKICDYEDLPE